MNNKHNNFNNDTSTKSYQVLTSYGLKMLGVVLMLLDHIYQMFAFAGAPLFLHVVGRIALPIFLFTASEGFHYTKNRRNYALRLLVGFWVMGIVNMVLSIAMPMDDVMLINNIFGTMFISVFYMWIVNTIKVGVKNTNIKQIIIAVLAAFVPVVLFNIQMAVLTSSAPLWVLRLVMIALPNLFTVEGGFGAVLLAVGFYLTRSNRWLSVLPLAILSIASALGGGFQWLMILAAIPILMYNGKPGKKSKYFFYAFYPLHIYILYIASYFLH